MTTRKTLNRWSCCSLVMMCLLAPSGRAQDTPVRVACVGNSITWGGLGDLSYPAQMGKLLGSGYAVRNFGVSGRTLLRKGDYPYWNEETFYDALDFLPHIVIIELGTNDTKPWNWTYHDQFFADYTDLIREFRSGGRNPQIYLCLPPPAFQTNFGITDSVIRKVIPLIDSLRRESHTLFIDLYSYFQGKGTYFPDGIHPNADGYGLMAALVRDSILASPAGFTRYFYAPSTLVERGESTTLYWEASPGSNVTLNGVPVATSDSLHLNPTSTVAYELISSGPRFVDTGRVVVRYLPPGKIRFGVVNPPILDLGWPDTSTLSWETAKGTLTASVQGTPVALSGSMTVSPATSTVYALTTTGDVPDTCLMTVDVLEPDSINRSRNASMAVSSFERHNPGALVVDGNRDSFWKSKSTGTQWITLDLKRSYDLRRVVLRWGSVFATRFNVQFIDETGNITAQRTYTGSGVVDDIRDLSGPGRYVKILLMSKLVPESGYVLGEIEAYGGRQAVTAVSAQRNAVADFHLEQNYPNPFNASTVISYTLPSETRVVLVAYNILGEVVDTLRDEVQPAGSHRVTWTPALASGVYFIRLQAQGATARTKTILLK